MHVPLVSSPLVLHFGPLLIDNSGLLTVIQGLVTSIGGLYVVRLFLGLAEVSSLQRIERAGPFLTLASQECFQDVCAATSEGD